jgi:hypothetical protein
MILLFDDRIQEALKSFLVDWGCAAVEGERTPKNTNYDQSWSESYYYYNKE